MWDFAGFLTSEWCKLVNSFCTYDDLHKQLNSRTQHIMYTSKSSYLVLALHVKKIFAKKKKKILA